MKKAKRPAIPSALKKKIFQEACLICPACGESNVNTLEIHHIRPYAEVNCHEENNLILLCSTDHAKADAGDLGQADLLRIKLDLVLGRHPFFRKSAARGSVHVSGGVNQGLIANHVTIKTSRKILKIAAPQGTVGASADHKNYVKHLIDRYHEFKRAEVGAAGMRYPIFYNAIKRNFGASWDMIKLEDFPDLCQFLQRRIDATILGKANKAADKSNYSSFLAFLNKPSTF